MSTRREKYFEKKLELLSLLTNDILFLVFIPILVFLIGGSMFSIEKGILILIGLAIGVYMATRLSKSFKAYSDFKKNNSVPE